MENFKVGQKVICIRSGEANNSFGGKAFIEKDKIYVVEKYWFRPEDSIAYSSWIIQVVGNSGQWVSSRFRPLKYNSATSDILEKFPVTEEKADVEIKELETVGCSPISETSGKK